MHATDPVIDSVQRGEVGSTSQDLVSSVGESHFGSSQRRSVSREIQQRMSMRSVGETSET